MTQSVEASQTSAHGAGASDARPSVANVAAGHQTLEQVGEETSQEPWESAPSTPDETQPPAKEQNQLWAWARDILETLVLAAIIFVLVNTLTGRYEVQSISMEPTLHAGQYLIVSKFTYWFHPPQRGDIVVLDPPDHRSSIPYIKRVIGLPGEHVEVRDGRVWINGVALNEPYVSGPALYQDDIVLGPDQYLVLGDNRNNSSDSHVWGTLPGENIIGKTIFRYWPPDKWGAIQHYRYPELGGTP